MRELGYVEGADFTVEWRFAEGRYERFELFAAELTGLPVDIIVLGTPAAVRATQRATSTIPIVIGYSIDPVGNGFVASLARPGGNTTGLASLLEEIVAKQVELLRATVPNVQRFAILTNPETRPARRARQRAGVHEEAGPRSRTLGSADVSGDRECVRDLARSGSGRADGVARRFLPFAKPQDWRACASAAGSLDL